MPRGFGSASIGPIMMFVESVRILHPPRHRWSAEVVEVTRTDGESLICKRATGGGLFARWALRRESVILQLLTRLGFAHAPRFVCFEDHMLTMTHLDAPTLSSMRGSLEGNAVLFRRIVDAVEALHEKGVAHGELRLGNLLAGTDRVYVVDYATAVRREQLLYPVFCQWDLLAVHWMATHVFHLPYPRPPVRWFDQGLIRFFARDIPHG
jgi:RIO-like serine/threonine protein kinase